MALRAPHGQWFRGWGTGAWGLCSPRAAPLPVERAVLLLLLLLLQLLLLLLLLLLLPLGP